MGMAVLIESVEGGKNKGKADGRRETGDGRRETGKLKF
jgi:hypothetical protein